MEGRHAPVGFVGLRHRVENVLRLEAVIVQIQCVHLEEVDLFQILQILPHGLPVTVSSSRYR